MVQIIVVSAFSQDTILFMDGKIKTGKIDFVNTDYIEFSKIKKNKIKTKFIDLQDVFSYKKLNAINEVIVYKQDTLSGNMLTVSQMKNYIQGMIDAQKEYKSPYSTITGFVAGSVGGVFGFWGTILPTSYIIINGSVNPKINIKNSNLEFDENILAQNSDNGMKLNIPVNNIQSNQNDDLKYYELGYKVKAKDKRTKNTIKGAFVGFVSLVATSYLLLH